MSGYFEQEIVWYECRMCGTVFWKIHLHFQIFFRWGGGGVEKQSNLKDWM